MENIQILNITKINEHEHHRVTEVYSVTGRYGYTPFIAVVERCIGEDAIGGYYELNDFSIEHLQLINSSSKYVEVEEVEDKNIFNDIEDYIIEYMK